MKKMITRRNFLKKLWLTALFSSCLLFSRFRMFFYSFLLRMFFLRYCIFLCPEPYHVIRIGGIGIIP